jgi:hypothetical protein
MSEGPVETKKLVWAGITIELKHRTRVHGLRDLHHLEVRSISPDSEALPITGTGYRSHFYYGDPIQDTVAEVSVWLDSEAKSEEWTTAQAAKRQMTLF